VTAKKAALGAAEIVSRPFGEPNRARLLDQWFRSAAPVTADTAWEHVYRLLLWIDRSTGLAHCYESDKSQPGRHWYVRSLAFHAWLSECFGVSPNDLGSSIDWLFRRVVSDLAAAVEARRESLLKKAEGQRSKFAMEFPEPGDDAELFEVITSTLEGHIDPHVPDVALRQLTQRIMAHLGQENKRKNLIGEGFEDVLASLITRLPGGERYEIHRRTPLHQLDGFYPPRGADKVKKVDLALVEKTARRRILVTAKWSIRADREEQLATDFVEYERLESAGEDFDYVLVTNEFDPARLAAACNRRSGNKAVFTRVVHVNPAGLVEAYDSEARGSAAEVLRHISAGRLESLGSWLSTFLA
jgi:hypothetical protein